MIGTASAGNISAVSRVAAAVESNNSNNQLTAQQRWDFLTWVNDMGHTLSFYEGAQLETNKQNIVDKVEL
jgi:hypothetical protein